MKVDVVSDRILDEVSDGAWSLHKEGKGDVVWSLHTEVKSEMYYMYILKYLTQ